MGQDVLGDDVEIIEFDFGASRGDSGGDSGGSGLDEKGCLELLVILWLPAILTIWALAAPK